MRFTHFIILLAKNSECEGHLSNGDYTGDEIMEFGELVLFSPIFSVVFVLGAIIWSFSI